MTGVICQKCNTPYVPTPSYPSCPRCEDRLPLPIPRLRQTHTFVELEVSAAAYDEIAAKLREAGYDHAFEDGAIDMHGIGLTRADVPPSAEGEPETKIIWYPDNDPDAPCFCSKPGRPGYNDQRRIIRESDYQKLLRRAAAPVSTERMVEAYHKLDTDTQVFFYEQEFYVLSNFSAFGLRWGGHWYPTSEHAYQVEKFRDNGIRFAISNAVSAHDAFKIAERNREKQRKDWNDVRVCFMGAILRAKVKQHEYVRRKLLETGDRELIEDSWRDDFWGWGPNRDGKNVLGKLWMEIRAELRESRQPEHFIGNEPAGA